MEGLLLIVLAVVALSIFLLVVAMLFRSLFWGAQDRSKQVASVLAWRPPFIRGRELRLWAADTTKRAADQRLGERRTGGTATALVRDINAGAVQAMLPLAGTAEQERVVPCPAHGQGVVGVTAPEALAIVADLRQKRSRFELQNIYELAAENAKRLATPPAATDAAPALRCPLQGDDRVCCAYAARPLHCLPLHATTVASGAAGSGVGFSGENKFTAVEDHPEAEVAGGVRLGLGKALKNAGMDATVYELNSALAQALATHDAAERWARGESVFAACQPVSAA